MSGYTLFSKLTLGLLSRVIFTLLLKLQEGFALASVVLASLLIYNVLTTYVFRVYNGKLIIPIENNLGSLANTRSFSSSIMPFC